MNNFYDKSREMYNRDQSMFRHFRDVFTTIGQIAAVRKFFEADLYNLEEILSILEIQEYLLGGRLKDIFIRYISDVIEYYTPDILPGEIDTPILKEDYNLFSGVQDLQWQPYLNFVGSILQAKAVIPKPGNTQFSEWWVHPAEKPTAHYALITLNYDRIPEIASLYLRSLGSPPKGRRYSGVQLGFGNNAEYLMEYRPDVSLYKPPLAKLHGSTDTTIVPPTWSKGTNTEVVPAWYLAAQVLREATQLRIVGYGFPETDTYIRYLLKAAIMENSFLKRIDVICRDSRGIAKPRYDEFIRFPHYRFVPSDIQTYLEGVTKYGVIRNETSEQIALVWDNLERGHAEFMESFVGKPVTS
jgi:hypothetical protein